MIHIKDRTQRSSLSRNLYLRVIQVKLNLINGSNSSRSIVFILIAFLFVPYISKLNVNEGKEILFSNHLRKEHFIS